MQYPAAVAMLDLHGVNLPPEQQPVKDAISAVLIYIELLRSGKFCKTCEGRGYRVVLLPSPVENGYSPLTVYPYRQVCYSCNGDCRERAKT